MISFFYCLRWLTINKPQPNLNQLASVLPGTRLCTTGEKRRKKIAVGEIKNRLAKRAEPPLSSLRSPIFFLFDPFFFCLSLPPPPRHTHCRAWSQASLGPEGVP